MFDWLFRPSCPCDEPAKAWVEWRLRWLADEFGDSAFTGRRLVLPTPACFPDPYDGSPRAVEALFDRVCAFMDVGADAVELRIVEEAGNKLGLVNEAGHDLPGVAGTYDGAGWRPVVRLDRDGLGDPMNLVGTMAHELAHVRLLGENRLESHEFDNELLTDLTVVHFGLGVFLANSPRVYAAQFTHWPGTRLVKPEYMNAPMFGWALAHLAWFRGEDRPEWGRHLHFGARADLRQGLRYLRATGDSAYKPVRLRGQR